MMWQSIVNYNMSLVLTGSPQPYGMQGFLSGIYNTVVINYKL